VPQLIRSTARTAARFAAGALLVNAIPHTVKGVTGQRFPTPFANPPGVGPSSPTENVAWGAINIAAGSALLGAGSRTKGSNLPLVVGGALMALFLSRYFDGVETRLGSRDSG
jgi:hypothetical protein